MDYSLPGSSVQGIFQVRILEWVAISFSRRSSWPRDWTQVSHIVGKTLYRLSHQGNPVIVKFYIFPFKKVPSIKDYWAWFSSFSCFKTIRGCKISFTHKNIMLPGNKTMTIVYWETQYIPVFCEDVSLKISLITKVSIQRQYTTLLLSEYSEIFFWQKEIQELLNVIYKWEKNF